MRDDAIGTWWYGGRQKKTPGKFFTYEEHGWSVILRRSGEFEEYLSRQKMSGSAMRTYPANVADFYEWMQDSGHQQPPRHLYREHVLQYRDSLVSRRVKPQTINHKLSALKKYNEYLIAHKYQRGEVFRRGDFLRITPKRPQAFGVSDTRIGAFLAHVRRTGNLRDVALVTLLAHTGMKLQEALDLRTSDVDWANAQVTVHAGDRKKARTVPLHDQAADALQAYGAVRRARYPQALSSLFPSRGSAKLTYSAVNRMFKKHSKTITPTTLRQAFQAGLLGQGATVAEVVHLTGADAQTVSNLVKRQAASLRKQINARQL